MCSSIINVHQSDKNSETLQIVEKYGTHIIIISMKYPSAHSLLVEARNKGFIWPQYAWIVLDTDSHFLTEVNLNSTMEGVIVIQCTNEVLSPSIVVNQACDMTKNASTYCGPRGVSRILHDSILAVVLAYTGSINISYATYEGAAGPVKLRNGNRLNNISLLQVINGSKFVIAQYSSESQNLTLSPSIFK